MKSYGVILLGLVIGCGGAKGPGAVDNRGGGGGGAAWIGHHACSIEQGGWRYTLYACDIRDEGGTLVLEKTEGQMRLRGTIAPDAQGGFTWKGEVWCTYTDECKGPVEATFVATDGGGWEAHVPAYPMATGDTMAPMVVTIVPEATVLAAGGKRYGAYGEAGWEGGAYTGEVPVD